MKFGYLIIALLFITAVALYIDYFIVGQQNRELEKSTTDYTSQIAKLREINDLPLTDISYYVFKKMGMNYGDVLITDATSHAFFIRAGTAHEIDITDPTNPHEIPMKDWELLAKALLK